MSKDGTISSRSGAMPNRDNNTEAELTMLHLRKLFDEFISLKSTLSENDRDKRLYQMLPLYCNVTNNGQGQTDEQKPLSVSILWDCHAAFCNEISQLLAREIKRRALNQSTETASKMIASFLELYNLDDTEELGNGFVLLTVINLMITANQDHSLKEIMINATLPSTLVRCIYLFLDLPEDPELFTTDSSDRRLLLYNSFSRILLHLCTHPLSTEELIRVDDLTLLFSTITTQYTCNRQWRSLAIKVICTIAQHGLSETILEYVHAKGCIALCVDNMQRGISSKPTDSVEVILSILDFLQQSTRISQVLLDDFKQCQGYMFLVDFLLKVDQDVHQEPNGQYIHEKVIQQLVSMVVSLCCGRYTQTQPDYSEVKLEFNGSRMLQETKRTGCVHNIHAFQVLQTVFLRSSNTFLCSIILDAIIDVYSSDKTNFFVLESQSTFCLFAEKIHQKPERVQTKFFELIEYIVFQLNAIPRKELIALSVLLKTNQSMEISLACIRTFLRILRHNNVFVDVYRDVGILEVFVTCLKRYKDFLKRKNAAQAISRHVVADEMDHKREELATRDSEELLGILIIDALVHLLNGNSNNTFVFKTSGGNKCIFEMLQHNYCSPPILQITKELLSTVGGEDDMLQLMKSMNISTEQQPMSISTRISILQALIDCLKESHRTRSIFRKVGGFLYVINILDLLKDRFCENQHCNESDTDVDKIDLNLILLLRVVCQTLSAAMRFEPANAKYFQNEIANTLFFEAIRDMGCFSKNEYIKSYSVDPGSTIIEDQAECRPHPATVDHVLVDVYGTIFKTSVNIIDNPQTSKEQQLHAGVTISPPLRAICIIYRILYDIALEGFDKSQLYDALHQGRSAVDKIPGNLKSSSETHGFNTNPPLPTSSMTPTANDHLIVHPCVIMCMLKLLPAVETQSQHSGKGKTTDWTCNTETTSLQCFLSDVIKSLVRSERNQQIMCDSGLTECILHVCKNALLDEHHPLHVSLQYIFERLAVQALKHMELRTFLRLSLDLLEEKDEATHTNPECDSRSLVPLTRVKTLVSITTPRDFRSHGSLTMPPFVEMDMVPEGFASLFFPNIAPNNQSAAYHTHVHGSTAMGFALNSNNGGIGIGGSVGSGASFSGLKDAVDCLTVGADGQSDFTNGGGIGSGDRTFSSNNGLTFSTWFCVERFPHPSQTDCHPVRLLHIIRSSESSSDESVVIFSVLIVPDDKSLSVATQEFPFTKAYCSVYKEKYMSRVWCPTFIQEGQWHHVAVTLGKTSPRHSLVSIYLDGRHVHSQKIHPIQSTPAGSTRGQTCFMHALIGTPPIWRMYSKLNWKQGVCHLIEDTFDAAAVARMHVLGPHYLGSFQDVRLEDTEEVVALTVEDRVVFGMNPKAVSHMTLSKIRKVFNRTDAKAIGKQLGMSSHENATPIVVLHNAAGHLNGPSRTLGGVLIGYLGIRKFNPLPVSMTLTTVGGCSVLLGLVAMSHNIESLYAAVKALTCILRSNKSARQEMNQRRYYQTLGMLYKKKKAMMNSHILHLTFNLVGTVHSGYETSSIPNVTAFQDLLCDFSIWLDPSCDMIRSLLEHLLELGTESNEKCINIRIMQDLQCVSKLLYILEDISDESALQALFGAIQMLLSYQTRSTDLLLFGQYIIKTIPTVLSSNGPHSDQLTDCQVKLRNRCLSILHNLLFSANNTINWRLCDEISRVLGLEWILLFMQPDLHHSTMLWAFRLLVVMLTRGPILARFRDGAGSSGEEGYLKNTDVIQQSRHAILLSSTLSSQATIGATTNSSLEENTSKQAPQLMGFPFLEWLLHHRTGVPEVYSLLIALMVGCPVKSLIVPSEEKSLESTWSFIWASASSTTSASPRKITFCPEAVCITLSLLRTIVHSKEIVDNQRTEKHAQHHWLQALPTDILRLLRSFYKHFPDFAPITTNGDVIVSLIAVLFAPSVYLDVDQEVSEISPDSSTVVQSPKSRSQIDKPMDSSPQVEDNFSSNNTTQRTNKSPEHKETVLQYGKHATEESITAQIMDFLQTIIIDSLPLLQSGKPTPVIDIVLEFFIIDSNVAEKQRKHFLTEIILLLMNNITSVNFMVDGPGISGVNANNIPPAGRQHVINNVFYLTTRFVDKLWQRMLFMDGREIFDYCVRLLQQIKRCSGRPVSSANTTGGIVGNGITMPGSMEPLYRSLNRCILYLLAYPPDPIDVTLVEILQKIMYNRLLLFGAGNHDPDFIGCLTYCLLQLNHGGSIVLSSPAELEQERTTIWHVPAPSSIKNVSPDLLNVTFRVWEELYVCKKPVIEEIFKITLTQPLHNARAPNMDRTYAQIFECAIKHWIVFIEGEQGSANRNPWDIHNSIQSKIKKVTGGITRLTSRTMLKKESCKRVVRRTEDFNVEAVRHLYASKVTLLREYWNFRLTQHGNSCMHAKRYVYQEWLQVESELIRERAIWGPQCCDDYTKWTLDNTEGPYRMRKKLQKNILFYVHYPPRPDTIDDSSSSGDNQHQRQIKCRVAISRDSDKYKKFIRLYRNMFPDQFDQDGATNSGLLKSNNTPINKSESEHSDSIKHDVQGYCLENEEEVSSSLPDNQILLRLLEDKEKVSHVFRTARIEGLDTFEGLLLFGKEFCYIVDGFTLLCNREIHDIETLPPESFEPIIPTTTSGNSQMPRNIRKCSKITYEDIREIHKRRYLLQPIALEVFCGNGQNYLLSFPQKVRNKVFQKLSSVATQIADNAQQSVAGQKRAASVEQHAGLLSSLIGETSVTQRWVRGEITNFQYLMHLNSLAGRSYNDLMQYPVFPWILANYESDTLDLNEPSNFRDLSKPMGAQTSDRLRQFQKRYRDWDDPQGDTPPYHYGTHYSSAMIVCSYLVRLEPFTQHFLRLQGGHFDLADRMFHSVKEAWHSASKQNMADVKELIPEFFYLPEFLENSNNFDLGTKQNGDVLNHVVLPPWAKDDPREFIRMHREALECDHVSRHLHLWIDLIFGYKQQGNAAVDAVNVYHHLFYEGNVDIYNIDDPLKKSAAIGFINNFGQIPKQLFRKPHPAKRMTPVRQFSMLMDVAPLIPPLSPIGGTPAINYEKIFFYHPNSLKCSQKPIKVKGPVGQIIQNEKNILAVEQNKILIPSLYNRYIAWGFADHSIRVGSYDSDRGHYSWENVDQCGEILCCTCPSAKLLIFAGVSSVLSVYNIDAKAKKINHKQTLFGHTDAVVALTSSSAYNIILSGSRDRSAIIWDLARLTYVRQLAGHSGIVSAVCINELTGDIATCSGTWLHVWSINGVQLAVVNTSIHSSDRMHQILCVCFSSIREWDANNVIITGSTDGVARMWSIDFEKKDQQNIDSNAAKSKPSDKSEINDNNVQSSARSVEWERKFIFRAELTLHTAYDRKNNNEPASITALAISKDHRTVYVGDARGRIYAWFVADPPFSNNDRSAGGLTPQNLHHCTSLDY